MIKIFKTLKRWRELDEVLSLKISKKCLEEQKILDSG